MLKKISLMLVFLSSALLLTSSVLAKDAVSTKDYIYQGQVKGMVCAFCAYNVSNKIAQVDGVDKDSVNVDLKSGEVNFRSALPIEQSQISKLFADSGFNLVSLNVVANSEFKTVNFSKNPVMTLGFKDTEIQTLDNLLDAIGSMAASKTSRLVVKAPKSIEIELLKPILAGRQRVIKVQFLPTQSTDIELKLYRVKTL